MFKIFFSHVKSVIIIYLSFLPLIIWKITCFTVKRAFSHINSMLKMGCQKINEDVAYAHNTESGCKYNAGMLLCNVFKVIPRSC